MAQKSITEKKSLQLDDLEIVGVTTIQMSTNGVPFVYIGRRYKDYKGKRVLVLIKLLE
ncbi:MAG: hypothetical protein JHC26_10860 [Thermofilum sp.]|jgi:hypothetical protein|uniref:hypothetical protein n=1 Tax=Thermofilum sp. TaxID=1961369 RepID=UPI00258EA0CE|nr:hypothetical protein [Thermofilum sp.]MCI4409582.1 hypothetical protein [Thermofilum sp.]